MKNKNHLLPSFCIIFITLSTMTTLIYAPYSVSAGYSTGESLALAILADPTTLISSSYWDRDNDGCKQATVLSSLGVIQPTHGNTFMIISTGVAGAVPVTTNALNPGDERGTYYKNKYGNPRDEATLTLTLRVPDGMHFLYYDAQFFTAEFPEYVGSMYNDRLTVTVTSPSQGTTEFICDVNSGDFVLTPYDIPGTGFDIFAQSGNPHLVDWVDTTPRLNGADAGATALIGRQHPVQPHEIITVTINIKDVGDSQFDSAAFIDNMKFSGYAKTQILARKTAYDLDGEFIEVNDTIKYQVTLSNIGAANQANNPGNEFEDPLPANVTYLYGTATASSGVIDYLPEEHKIIWNGNIPAKSSVILTFKTIINPDLENGTILSNQGIVYWDKDENGTNEAVELTDNPLIDDAIDQDGDGDTGDDDPTILMVYTYEVPPKLVEDFSDDEPRDIATQSFLDYQWFQTTATSLGSKFEVSNQYHYYTFRGFKIQLRSSAGKQYWLYNLTKLNAAITYWESWFACGNASEASDLTLRFLNDANYEIMKLKFEYLQHGKDNLTDYLVRLYYWSGPYGWQRLYTDYSGGYLYNGWYKIRLEQNGTYGATIRLYQNNQGLVDTVTMDNLIIPFTQITKVEWSTTKEPIICPMFFWDEHSIGLIEKP